MCFVKAHSESTDTHLPYIKVLVKFDQKLIFHDNYYFRINRRSEWENHSSAFLFCRVYVKTKLHRYVAYYTVDGGWTVCSCAWQFVPVLYCLW